MDGMREIGRKIRKIGMNNTYRGFSYTIKALKLICEDEENLHPVNKKIYHVIADETGQKQSKIQSAIRKAAEAAWESNTLFFKKYETTLLSAPSNVKFLEILLRYLNDLEK